jgi:HSP20 family protein
MSLTRWSPFEGLERWFEGGFPALAGMRWQGGVDMYEEGDKLVVELAAPGWDPRKLKVRLEGQQLRVWGEESEREERKERNYFYQQISQSSFDRSIPLPYEVASAAGQMDAEYLENGILRVMLTKKAAGKAAQEIPVKSKK